MDDDYQSLDDATLDDGTQMQIVPALDPDHYAMMIVSPDNVVLYKIVSATISDLLNNKTITDAITAHGFTTQAVQAAFQNCLKAHVDIPLAHNVDLDLGVDASHSDPGVHVGINIKF